MPVILVPQPPGHVSGPEHVPIPRHPGSGPHNTSGDSTLWTAIPIKRAYCAWGSRRTAGFIGPCLPSPAKKPPNGSTGCTKSSTMASASWPGATAPANNHSSRSLVKITDYLAIWGAVVATVVAAWNIYKDFLKRHRVKVSARVLFAGDGSPSRRSSPSPSQTYLSVQPRSQLFVATTIGVTNHAGLIA